MFYKLLTIKRSWFGENSKVAINNMKGWLAFMTVDELFELCKQEIEHGNGDRNIVLCVNDDEFHALENKFSSPVCNDSAIYDLLEEWGEEEDNVIVLN